MLRMINPDFEFKDERGVIIQLVHKGYNQFNLITSKKDVVRGNHYHKLNKEAFYVISGETEVEVNGEVFVFKAGNFFDIEPYDMHSFRYLSDTVLVSMYSMGVELPSGEKDIYVE